jgi:heavy metal sensor kinase
VSRAGAPNTLRFKVGAAAFLVLLAAFAVMAAFVDFEVRRHALAALDTRLASEASALGILTTWSRGRVGLNFEDETMPAYAVPGNGAYFQVSTPEGLVERSDSLAERGLPAVDARAFVDVPADQPRILPAVDIEGPWEPRGRMVTVVLSRPSLESGKGANNEPADHAPRQPVAIQVARTLAGVDAEAADVRKALLLALPLALALAAVGAILVSRHATRPVLALGTDVQRIASGDLDSRVDAERVEGELRGLARTLNQAFDRLSEAAARERRFSADVAHELRTPLSLLRAKAELALSRERTAPDYQEALRGTLAAAVRMQRLVEEMLLLARCENRAMPTEVLDLRDVARRAVESAVVVAGAPAGAVTLTLPDAAVIVHGSTPLLQRSVESVLENALRHGASDAPVELRLAVDDGRARLDVLDRGPGFPPELLPNAFERFARGDASRSRDSGGSGLGLSIVRTVARAHGGDAEAAARDGGGARVTLTLPLAGGGLAGSGSH